MRDVTFCIFLYESTLSFLEELESDILEECCQCGNVKRVLSLNEKCGYSGCVAVTFCERGNLTILCLDLYHI